MKCISLGSDKYGDCIRYAEGKKKPDLPNGDRFCNARVGWDYKYCIDFKCALTACAHPLVAPYKKCPFGKVSSNFELLFLSCKFQFLTYGNVLTVWN